MEFQVLGLGSSKTCGVSCSGIGGVSCSETEGGCGKETRGLMGFPALELVAFIFHFLLSALGSWVRVEIPSQIQPSFAEAPSLWVW